MSLNIIEFKIDRMNKVNFWVGELFNRINTALFYGTIQKRRKSCRRLNSR